MFFFFHFFFFLTNYFLPTGLLRVSTAISGHDETRDVSKHVSTAIRRNDEVRDVSRHVSTTTHAANGGEGEGGMRIQGPNDETRFRRLCPRLETRLQARLEPQVRFSSLFYLNYTN